MRRLLLLTCFLPLLSVSQNLLVNGSFEDENICTEYIHNCAPEAWMATSLKANYYFDDPPNAYAGQHFIGLIAGDLYASLTKPARVFIRSRLLCGLRESKQYNLEFYIRSAHNILDSVGIYFTPKDFLFEKKSFKEIEPALWVKDAKAGGDSDFKIWHKVSFTYTATGNENFIVIGNFKRGEYSNVRKAEFASSYYFFIDDMSLTAADPHEKLCLAADSIREVIYDEDDRHALLQKRIYASTKRPPPDPVLSKTTIQRIDTLIIPDILFATNSYVLNEKANDLLDSFSIRIRDSHVDSLVIEGHTDSTGSVALNEKLSANRAGSVAAYLLKVANSEHVVTRGLASEYPVADNRTPAGRQRNRRVAIYLYIRE
jgi:outer membrane protein OmpA-like peptidoglycan-associated protein